MALTELQLPVKEDFYRRIRNEATQINESINRWKSVSEFINLVQTADLDAMGVPAGQLRTDLVEFRTMLDEIVSFLAGTPTTVTNNPTDVLLKLRKM